jgi:hypothetical protein
MARRVPVRATLSGPAIGEKIQTYGRCFAIGLAKPCIRFRVSRRFDADALLLPPLI